MSEFARKRAEAQERMNKTFKTAKSQNDGKKFEFTALWEMVKNAAPFQFVVAGNPSNGSTLEGYYPYCMSHIPLESGRDAEILSQVGVNGLNKDCPILDYICWMRDNGLHPYHADPDEPAPYDKALEDASFELTSCSWDQNATAYVTMFALADYLELDGKKVKSNGWVDDPCLRYFHLTLNLYRKAGPNGGFEGPDKSSIKFLQQLKQIAKEHPNAFDPNPARRSLLWLQFKYTAKQSKNGKGYVEADLQVCPSQSPIPEEVYEVMASRAPNYATWRTKDTPAKDGKPAKKSAALSYDDALRTFKSSWIWKEFEKACGEAGIEINVPKGYARMQDDGNIYPGRGRCPLDFYVTPYS